MYLGLLVPGVDIFVAALNVGAEIVATRVGKRPGSTLTGRNGLLALRVINKSQLERDRPRAILLRSDWIALVLSENSIRPELA
jgi:hypothetical protein